MDKIIITDNVKRNVIGHKVQQLRLEKGYTQQNLAELLEQEGVYANREIVSAIERHLRKVLDFELVALAKCLEVSVSDLFEA